MQNGEYKQQVNTQTGFTYHILEDKGERLSRVDNVVEGDDVGVFELLQERRLPDGSERRALLLL